MHLVGDRIGSMALFYHPLYQGPTGFFIIFDGGWGRDAHNRITRQGVVMATRIDAAFVHRPASAARTKYATGFKS